MDTRDLTVRASEAVVNETLLIQGIVDIEPGRDIGLSVDATKAFSPVGTLPVEGSGSAVDVTVALANAMGRQNYYAVVDAHVPGSAHSHDAYTDEAGVVPNVTTLTEDLIARWMKIGESKILRPHAQFSLRQLRTEARLTRLFTHSDQIVWKQHAEMGGFETQFIYPLLPSMFCNIFFKGTHPVHDSHSGIWDAVGNPVGVMAAIAAREQPVRRVLLDGNALEVCVCLTAKHLCRFGFEVYLVVDAVGYLSFITEEKRRAILSDLLACGVRFVHSSQLKFN